MRADEQRRPARAPARASEGRGRRRRQCRRDTPPPGEERAIPVGLRCSRWGVYDVGTVEVRARDAFRLVVWEARLPRIQGLKAYPHSEALARVLDAAETQAFTGSAVARVKGDGIEYADIRDYVPGDRLRSINWRASARRTGLVVNEQHPERNTDVVVFVDSFADLRDGSRSTLDDAVRAAATLASPLSRAEGPRWPRLLRRRPALATARSGAIAAFPPDRDPARDRRRAHVPLARRRPDPGANPPPEGAGDRADAARRPALRQRRCRTCAHGASTSWSWRSTRSDVVEAGRSELERLAYRLWLLDREVLRSRLERLGIGIARWGDGVALESALEEVRTYRRYARVGRV